jgi:hypothetical protein
MLKARIAVIVSGGGTNLQALIDCAGRGEMPHGEIVLVVADKAGVKLLMAKPKYCGDNAAMIAGLAYYRQNPSGIDAERVDVHPSLEAGES